MLLNDLSQQFCIYFDYNTFYPEVNEVWKPLLKRMSLPYMNIEDFMNSQIQSFNFPGFSSNNPEQQIGLYPVQKRPGYQMDNIMRKEISITFKLTESYISYFIMRQQYDLFLKLITVKDLYFAPISVSLIDDAGFENITYIFHQITPKSISDLDLNYTSRLGQYHSFSMSFSFNYFDIWYRTEDGSKILIDYNKINGKRENRIEKNKNILLRKMQKITTK